MSIKEIASWQIPALSSVGSMRAELPALQRGSVWKPQQTERLWDSLVRGFPIGAFLVSKFDADYGYQSFRLEAVRGGEAPTHHLLDGQQRATSIALGFFDIWGTGDAEGRKNGPALWVDIGQAPERDDRKYVFRLVTRAHPWGYKRTNPEERLETSQIRKAFAAFKNAAPGAFSSCTPAEFPLQHSWPWDGHAPIPLPFLIQALESGTEDICGYLAAQLRQLPFFAPHSTGGRLKGDVNFRERIEGALKGTDHALSQRLEMLTTDLRLLLSEDDPFRIPALVLPHNKWVSSEEPRGATGTDGQAPDSIETLFVRVNSGGTRLDGEELIYSLLKSAWVEAPQALSTLQPDGHHLIARPRLVALIARLLMARQQQADNSGKYPDPPAMLDVAGFRRKASEPSFYPDIREFVSKSGKEIFKQAHLFLALDTTTENDFRLPPSLAADLSHGTVGADVMFLLLRWLDRMNEAGINALSLEESGKRRVLGFLTAIAWFSKEGASGRCVRRLWQALQSLPKEQLPHFFNKTRFRELLPPDPRTGLLLLPIVPPDILDRVREDRVTSANGFNQSAHGFWETGRWKHYYASLVSPQFSGLNGQLQRWLRSLPIQVGRGAEVEMEFAENQDRNEVLREAWDNALDRMWSSRRLLQYAQRYWLAKWFPHFDPSLPEQMEDINRPWDYDHIHPQSFVSGKRDIPSVVRDWHASIGNLRAWPLELNRGDGDDEPAVKLVGVTEAERKYEMVSPLLLRNASFVDEDFAFWQHSVPESAATKMRYLSQSEHHKARQALVRAITMRFCGIYREWHDNLRLGELSPG